ncbi:MAG: hypothetical protein V4611_03765 [Patescibacteria group bacterium]
MAKKDLTPEKAAAKISNMIASGDAKTAKEAVEKDPELEPGLKFFDEESKPVSTGSGPAVLDRPRF